MTPPATPPPNVLRIVAVHRLHTAVQEVIQTLALTNRLAEVLRLAVDGRTRVEMARAMGVSRDTVNSYSKLICRKAGAPHLPAVVNDVYRLASGLAYGGMTSPGLARLGRRWAAAGL